MLADCGQREDACFPSGLVSPSDFWYRCKTYLQVEFELFPYRVSTLAPAEPTTP